MHTDHIDNQLTDRSPAGDTVFEMLVRTISLLIFVLFGTCGGVDGFYRAHTKSLPRGWGRHSR